MYTEISAYLLRWTFAAFKSGFRRTYDNCSRVKADLNQK